MIIPHEGAYLASATVCAAVATITDFQSRRIPNWLTGAAFAAGLVLHLVCGGLVEGSAALIAGLVAGGVCLLFFLAGGMGAGDVKLMTAVGSLAGFHALPAILLFTALLGAVTATLAALVRGRMRETISNVCTIFAHHQEHGLLRHPEIHVQNSSLLRMPYAFSVAGGCTAALILSLHGSIPR